MNSDIPEELANDKYGQPPYKWEVNPKYETPHLGPYIYVTETTLRRQTVGATYYIKYSEGKANE